MVNLHPVLHACSAFPRQVHCTWTRFDSLSLPLSFSLFASSSPHLLNSDEGAVVDLLTHNRVHVRGDPPPSNPEGIVGVEHWWGPGKARRKRSGAPRRCSERNNTVRKTTCSFFSISLLLIFFAIFFLSLLAQPGRQKAPQKSSFSAAYS